MKKMRRDYEREYDSQEVINEITGVCERLFNVYNTKGSPEKICDKMIDLLQDMPNITFLGRGQNRVAFMHSNGNMVYKFPYREIGFQDNALERYISSVVTSNAEAYDALEDHMAFVSDFNLGAGYEDLCISMEYLDDLGADDSIGTPESKAIDYIVDHPNDYIEAAKELNEYFHLIDAHPVRSAMNWGLKNGKIAIRDYGYFIARVGELAVIENTVQKQPVQYLYNTEEDVLLDRKLSHDEKIAKLEQSVECWVPVNEDGEVVGSSDDLVDIYQIGQKLLKAFREMI